MQIVSRRATRVGWGSGLTLAVFAILLATSPAWAQEAAGAGAAKTKTMLEMIKHGGPTLVVLGLCSVFTLTLIIERFMYYRKAAGSAAEIVEQIKQSGTLSEALQATENAPGMAARVLRSAVQHARDGHSVENIEQLVQGQVTKELINMEKFLPQLDSMVTMCPVELRLR